MEKKFVIKESTLRKLVRGCAENSLLEASGVDNWSGWDYRDETFWENFAPDVFSDEEIDEMMAEGMEWYKVFDDYIEKSLESYEVLTD